ncbi:MAG TPA: PorV/PorQ family protein [Balneolaceae bacterium]|nr:PorV/PorQ family protein [Balneolaceae bacterium]
MLSEKTVAQQSGLDLLITGPNSHALGLNEAITAEPLGASDLYSNPANLALEDHSAINADYTLWIGDITHAHAAINLKNNSHALAFGFLGSQVSDIPLRGNQAGPAQGTFNVSFLSLSGAYAYKLGPVALGGTMQYLREEYYVYNASGYAFNLGAATKIWNGRLQLGTSLLNLGKMDKLQSRSTRLPTTFRAGINTKLLSFTPPENNNLPIAVYLKDDFVAPVHTFRQTTQDERRKGPFTNIALELNIAQTVSLRTGYKTGNTVRHWSAGMGIELESITANYAIIPFETGYGTVHSLGISYRF